jgi:hypothetical protein
MLRDVFERESRPQGGVGPGPTRKFSTALLGGANQATVSALEGPGNASKISQNPTEFDAPGD